MCTGEDYSELFEEFVVSKEDLQAAGTGSSDSPVNSITSQHSLARLSRPSKPFTLPNHGLQQIQEPHEQGHNHTWIRVCDQTADTSAPPLSPSIDGSQDSPTLTNSFTFAGRI